MSSQNPSQYAIKSQSASIEQGTIAPPQDLRLHSSSPSESLDGGSQGTLAPWPPLAPRTIPLSANTSYASPTLDAPRYTAPALPPSAANTPLTAVGSPEQVTGFSLSHNRKPGSFSVPYLPGSFWSSMSSQQNQGWSYNTYEQQAHQAYAIPLSDHGFKAPQMRPWQTSQLASLPSNWDNYINSMFDNTSEAQHSKDTHRTNEYLPPTTFSSMDSDYYSMSSPGPVSDLYAEKFDEGIQNTGLLSNPSPPASTSTPSDQVAVRLYRLSNWGDNGSYDNNNASQCSSLAVPSVLPIAPQDADQAACSPNKIQSSSRILANPPSPIQKIRTFPWLGFNTTNDIRSYTSEATPEDGQSYGMGLRTIMTGLESSPSRSDLSSSGWTEDGQDADTLRVISISSNILSNAYINLATSYTSEVYVNMAMDDSPSRKAPRKQILQTQNSSNSRKRKLNRSHSGSDDFEDNGDPKRQKNGSTQSTLANSDSLPLACPFNKYDSVLFGPDSSEEAYHACATCSFVNIAYLKQHLQRNHYMPKYYCFRCCSRFTSQAMAASHMRRHPPCEILDPPLYRERIGPDMIEDLGLDRKNPPGTDRVEYWHRLYNAFFPGAAIRRPVSPYYEGPAAQHMARFLHFSRPAIRDLLPEVQQRLGLEGTLSDHYLHRLMEEILEVAAQRYLQRLTDLGAFQIGQANSVTTIGSTVASQPETASSNADTNNEAAHPASTSPPSLQESLQDSSQPSVSAASLTLGSTTESPSIPRTPLPTIAPSRMLERSTIADGPLAQNLPVEPINNSEDLSPFDVTIAYDPAFDWAAELDSMVDSDWDSFRPEAADVVKTKKVLGSENTAFN